MGSKVNGQSGHLDITHRLIKAGQRENLPGLAHKIDFPVCVKINVGCSSQVGCAAVRACVCVCWGVIYSGQKKSQYGVTQHRSTTWESHRAVRLWSSSPTKAGKTG